MKRFPLLALTAVLCAGTSHAQVLTEWVESKLPGDTTKIALGYPVPMPVDTPEPFDGFRTYAGLHMRHQDLAVTTPYVHPEQVGVTRHGRTIWAYRLGDDDLLTVDGLPEAATLANGGIHAREWQTPEVVTGILELIALHEPDQHLYDYLRDNVNMIVIPSLNIDGFLQTQRYPSLDYLQSDPDDPDFSPRDGRMRRKNMLNADEDLYTTYDHLNGVDLNRNNAPYWATNPARSSDNPQSLVHHGAAPASEPETQALDAAGHLGPIERLRAYTDVHSFGINSYWSRTNYFRLAAETERVQRLFSSHQRTFPEANWYAFPTVSQAPYLQGIGSTDEYFADTYRVPAWGLEVEPGINGSVEYGGTGENGHDGFILPESEIRRLSEHLAQSFAAVYYRQAGPPSLHTLRLIDADTGAVVFESEWDIVDDQARSMYRKQLQPLQFDHRYHAWLAFDKPMRWRQDGQVVPFPGQADDTLDLEADILVRGVPLTASIESAAWLDQAGGAPDGYMRYRDDALKVTFTLPADESNLVLVSGQEDAVLALDTTDMTGRHTDANPATVPDWVDGAWRRYESTSGTEGDLGGTDQTISFQVTDQPVPPPFVLEPGITSAWYDPSHSGEGFLLEILANDRAAMYWFTYDSEGAQDWYIAIGDIRGNRIEFAQLLRVSGGEFGPGFDPAKITEEPVGSASFIWSGCDSGDMSYRIGKQHGRMQLFRLTRLMGIDCGNQVLPPESEVGLLSGSWYDPTHSGEGYNIEVLIDGRAVAYWFSYDPDGKRRWFFGLGETRDGKLVFDDMQTSSGGIFGPDFDKDLVEYQPWGTLELDIDCHGGTATYASTEAGFGSGTLNVIRLTNIDRLGCPDPD